MEQAIQNVIDKCHEDFEGFYDDEPNVITKPTVDVYRDTLANSPQFPNGELPDGLPFQRQRGIDWGWVHHDEGRNRHDHEYEIMYDAIGWQRYREELTPPVSPKRFAPGTEEARAQERRGLWPPIYGRKTKGAPYELWPFDEPLPVDDDVQPEASIGLFPDNEWRSEEYRRIYADAPVRHHSEDAISPKTSVQQIGQPAPVASLAIPQEEVSSKSVSPAEGVAPAVSYDGPARRTRHAAKTAVPPGTYDGPARRTRGAAATGTGISNGAKAATTEANTKPKRTKTKPAQSPTKSTTAAKPAGVKKTKKTRKPKRSPKKPEAITANKLQFKEGRFDEEDFDEAGNLIGFPVWDDNDTEMPPLPGRYAGFNPSDAPLSPNSPVATANQGSPQNTTTQHPVNPQNEPASRRPGSADTVVSIGPFSYFYTSMEGYANLQKPAASDARVDAAASAALVTARLDAARGRSLTTRRYATSDVPRMSPLLARGIGRPGPPGSARTVAVRRSGSAPQANTKRFTALLDFMTGTSNP